MLEKDALVLADDEAYLQKFHLPGIRVLGGAEGCLALAKCEIQTF